MFVDIDEPKAPLKVEVMLFPYKKGTEKITPEVCLNVLKSTNYQRSIKDMLGCIGALPKEEQAQFKDVVLSTFDNREQPNDVLVLGKKLAVSGGYEEELAFASAGMRVGYWLTSHAVAEKWKIGEDCRSDDLKGNIWFLDEELRFDGSDLRQVTGLKFQNESEVSIWRVKNLPANLDVSKCSLVHFDLCDLEPVKELKFRDEAFVHLNSTKNLPPDLDVSMCSLISVNNCDLSPVKNLKFRDGANVRLAKAENLPEDLDVSMCNKLYFRSCNLRSVKELNFRDGADVVLWLCANLPEKLDFSKCAEVKLMGCDLNNVQHITFKNKEQMGESDVKFPENWKGQVIFADEVKKNERTDSRSVGFFNKIGALINGSR